MAKDVIAQLLIVLGGRYFDAIAHLLRLVFKELKNKQVISEIPEFLASPSIDDRIAKLDETRKNLLESLDAVDQLQRDALLGKQQLEEALAQLERARAEHNSTQKELESLRQIAKSDITSFRKMAGVPNIWVERTVGFFGGVVASLIASGLLFLGAQLLI